MISVTREYPSAPNSPSPAVQIVTHRIQNGRHVARVWVTSAGGGVATFNCTLEDLRDHIDEAITKMDADTI